MTVPNYYIVLEVPHTATVDEIRDAYKKKSLKTHPDRFPNSTQEERKRNTEKFQALADAYYVLSDTTRRKEYDALLASSKGPSNAQFFANTAAFQNEADPDTVFADVFEEMLRPEVERVFPLWTWLGAVCGAGVGFIIANFPGLMLGAVAGNRLGAIRDAKGKSVAAVFVDLGANQKVEILRHLAMKVLGTM